jgi:hypothetical protein
VYQDLGIRVASEAVSVLLELTAKIQEIVDRAIEYHCYPAIVGAHGLPPGIAQVEDRRPAMTKNSMRPDLNALGIRTTTLESGHHRRDAMLRCPHVVLSNDAGDSAHGYAALPFIHPQSLKPSS